MASRLPCLIDKQPERQRYWTHTADYTFANFHAEIERRFTIEARQPLANGTREVLLLIPKG